MLYFHQLSQLHWSCSQLPLFLPSTLGNTIHSEEEEGKGMTHICFLSGSGALGRMSRILSISGGSGQAREQEMLCHSVSFQNVCIFHWLPNVKFIMLAVDSKSPLWFISLLLGTGKDKCCGEALIHYLYLEVPLRIFKNSVYCHWLSRLTGIIAM